jgi:hypothetical protein
MTKSRRETPGWLCSLSGFSIYRLSSLFPHGSEPHPSATYWQFSQWHYAGIQGVMLVSSANGRWRTMRS